MGYLLLEVNKTRKYDIVGGLKPPIISLRNGQPLLEDELPMTGL